MWHTRLMNRLTLGDFEISIFSDGTYPLDGGAFFGVVPKVMWSRRVEADDRNYVTAGLNSLLIRTGKQTVLVETGMGNKLSERMVKFYGQPAKLLDNLAAGGHRARRRRHRDQLASALRSLRMEYRARQERQDRADVSAREILCARGRVAVRAAARASATAISFISDNYDPLVASGQMTLLKGGEEIVPGISVETFPGHTAHMQGVIVQSQGQTACYISDLIPTTAHIDISWGMGFDLYPLQTIESKKQYYATVGGGEVADGLHARSEDAVGLRGEG